MARGEAFTTVRTLGGLLPSDLLQRVADLDRNLPGLTPEAYGLGAGERLREAITRSWSRLIGVWEGFRHELERLPEGDRATSVTRDRWLLVLLQELGFGRVPTAAAHQVGGVSYAISHAWGPVPIHLLGWGIDIERRTEGVAGAATMSPHALVQEFLNRSDDHLWSIVSNGRVLRLLRDNLTMTRQAFVEFDLEAMMDGEVYADFVLLWLVCHATRFEGDRPELCLLEQWTTVAHREGTRALDKLRDGVEAALRELGSGLVDHPANARLRQRLESGELTPVEFYRQLLRVIYRLLFLFFAEDRDLLLLRGDEHQLARQRYRRWYSTQALRTLARQQAGGRHDDRWDLLARVFRMLGSPVGCPDLALPALGSGLWDPELTPDVVGTSQTTRVCNGALLEAIRQLAWTVDDAGVARAVDYRNLGAEELGSVYEALLELHPEVSVTNGTFTLTAGAGNERKTTGSYYTPTSLITQLLDTALDPVLDRAAASHDPQQALLDITVCDPACGSGHFLVAAAHRIARRLAAVRSGDGEASPEAVQEAMRDVVSRCLYGVDINPMAIELARVNLWLEAQLPGKPLTFLDHHLKVGNALLGATPALIGRGIPDDAFKPLEGDDRKVVSELRKQNRRLRESGQQQLRFAAEQEGSYEVLAGTAAELTALPDDTVEQQQAKAKAHERFEASERLRRARLTADTWCAAFTAKRGKVEGSIDEWPHELFYELRDGTPPPTSTAYQTVAAEQRQYRFFHWHIEFPHLFTPLDNPSDDDPTGWRGGFTVMLGNPPWERVKLQEQEWWASRDPEIAQAPNAAARKRRIKAVEESSPVLHREFLAAKRQAEAWSHLLRQSGRYPLTGVGDINTYQVFAETFRHVTSETGRAGFIVPTGIATDHTTRAFFGELVETKSLVSLFDFENAAPLFPGVHRSYKFCLLTLAGEDARVDAAEFAFFAHDTSDLRDPERRFVLTPEDIELINPNTKTAPVFRTRRDAEICAKIYRNVPVLIREGDPDGNPWGLTFTTMFHMSNDSGLFRTRDQLESDGWHLNGNVFERATDRYLPLYEAKMIHQFDHRWATYEPDGTIRDVTPEEKADPAFEPMPRYWVPEAEVEKKLSDKGWTHNWLLGWRDICRNTDERTAIFTLLPIAAVGHTMPLVLTADAGALLDLQSGLCSYAFDYAARLKVGGTHLTYSYLEQLPMPARAMFEASCGWNPSETFSDFVAWRRRELISTSRRIGNALGVNVFGFDVDRRQLLRAELDAAFFHLYGLDRDEVDYVMDTFPIVRRKDEREHGEYRTKRLILEIYDEMAKAMETGEPYQTRLDPPPADPSLQHPVS